MCLICVELTKDKLSPIEARRNLGEMRNNIEKEHILDVIKLIWKKEDEEYAAHWHENETCIDTD